MIYTVTFNPAVDLVIRTDKIETGSVNRTRGEEIYFGGKGVNVSTVLKELGVESKALGFVAGFTGEAIERSLREKGIETDFVHLEQGFSRINVKIRSESETDFNGFGPVIDARSVEKFFEKLDAISDGDTLVIAGSIPQSLNSDIYEKILERLRGKNIRTVVDATKDLLMNTLKYRPFLIKPNHYELGELFGALPETDAEIIEYAQRLKAMGAQNVLVSMAEKGALLLDEKGDVRFCGACSGAVKNSVGAGDSMVAGFIAGLSAGDYDYALRLATAAGGATAFSDGLGEKRLIDKLLKQL